jgi:hypothetical protein
MTFPDVTLERGATQDRDLFDRFQQVANLASGLGLNDIDYKRNLDIVQRIFTWDSGATIRVTHRNYVFFSQMGVFS